MRAKDFWKNFGLGEELQVAGTFIYNGLRRFHELRKLDHTDEIFETLYNLSIGLERLMKIAVVLLEDSDVTDQAALEASLITHSHQELIARIQQHVDLRLGTTHNDFLAVLTTFYKSMRYDRFSLGSIARSGPERDQLLHLFEKHLQAKFERRDSVFGVFNDEQYRKFINRVVLKLSNSLYEVIKNRARDLHLYTYELRSDSKAETVFLGNADIPAEDVLWKELLVFFMNTGEVNGYLGFLRDIEPLKFDPALVGDYLDCFQSDSKKSVVMDELHALYEDVGDKSTRLEMLKLIGNPNVCFDEDEDESEDSGFDDTSEKT